LLLLFPLGEALPLLTEAAPAAAPAGLTGEAFTFSEEGDRGSVIAILLAFLNKKTPKGDEVKKKRGGGIKDFV